MNPSIQPMSEKPVQASKFLSIKNIVLALAILVAICTTSVAAFVLYENNNSGSDNSKQSNLDELPTSYFAVEPTPTSYFNITEATEESLKFSSSRYNVSFEYPKRFGEIQVKYLETYFKNESVSFSNSPISVSYTRFEGASGGYSKQYEVQSKDGRTFKIFTGDGSDPTSNVFFAQSMTNGKTVTIIANGVSSNTFSSIKADIEKLISTLSYDFPSSSSSVPTQSSTTSTSSEASSQAAQQSSSSSNYKTYYGEELDWSFEYAEYYVGAISSQNVGDFVPVSGSSCKTDNIMFGNGSAQILKKRIVKYMECFGAWGFDKIVTQYKLTSASGDEFNVVIADVTSSDDYTTKYNYFAYNIKTSDAPGSGEMIIFTTRYYQDNSNPDMLKNAYDNLIKSIQSN